MIWRLSTGNRQKYCAITPVFRLEIVGGFDASAREDRTDTPTENTCVPSRAHPRQRWESVEFCSRVLLRETLDASDCPAEAVAVGRGATNIPTRGCEFVESRDVQWASLSRRSDHILPDCPSPRFSAQSKNLLLRVRQTFGICGNLPNFHSEEVGKAVPVSQQPRLGHRMGDAQQEVWAPCRDLGGEFCAEPSGTLSVGIPEDNPPGPARRLVIVGDFGIKPRLAPGDNDFRDRSPGRDHNGFGRFSVRITFDHDVDQGRFPSPTATRPARSWGETSPSTISDVGSSAAS